MKFFEKDELKLLWPFYLEGFLNAILTIFPAFYIIFLKGLNFSLFEIGILGSIICLTGLLFEVPTGAVADLYGRKFSTFLGYFLTSVSLGGIYFVNNFLSAIILFVCWGISSTFISGARDAWIMDYLKDNKKSNLIKEYYTKRQSIISAGFLISGFLGALIVKQMGISTIWLISGGALLLGILILFPVKENFKRKSYSIKQHFLELYYHSKESMKYASKHPAISKLLIIAAIVPFVIGIAGDISWYPLLQNLGLLEYQFGYFFSLTFVMGIILPFLVNPLVKKIGSYGLYLVFVFILMSLISISALLINGLLFGLILGLLFLTSWDLIHPVRNIILQQSVPSKMRATIGSFENMIYSITGVFTFSLGGYLCDKLGVQNAIAFATIFFIPLIIISWKLRKHQ